jgi:hypothetical protein
MNIKKPLTKQLSGDTPIRLILEIYLNKTSKKQWILDCNYFEEMKNKALQTYDTKGLFQRLIIKNYSYFGRGDKVFDGFSEDLPRELSESERVNWGKWMVLYKLYDECLSQSSSVSTSTLIEFIGGNIKYNNEKLDDYFSDYSNKYDGIDLCNISFKSSKDLFINSSILWFLSDAYQDGYKWGSSISMLTHFGVKRPSLLKRLLMF